MTKRNEVYKCDVCGNIVTVLHEGAGTLVCCNQNMRHLTENTQDAATEKHVPVVEETEEGILVKVGEVNHPMEESHYIEWIEVITKEGSNRVFLKPGDKPSAEFPLKKSDVIAVREFCNLHGLWKK